MKKLIILMIIQCPLYVFGQQMDNFKLCSETSTLFLSYDVCTYDDTEPIIFFSDTFNSIYEAFYDLHFDFLDTLSFHRPDSGQLIRFWYIDKNGGKSRIDRSNCELHNAKDIFERLNEQLWGIVSKWTFIITDVTNSSWPLEPEPKDVWIDFVFSIATSKP